MVKRSQNKKKTLAKKIVSKKVLKSDQIKKSDQINFEKKNTIFEKSGNVSDSVFGINFSSTKDIFVPKGLVDQVIGQEKSVEIIKKAAAQKTLNNLNSKSHLKTEGDGAGDSNASTIPLPAETLAMYMDSGMTEKQARAFHKKLYG